MAKNVMARAGVASRFQLTPGVANALSASLNGSYQQYFISTVRGASTKEAERGIAAVPEGKRYLTRVLDSLDNAFASSAG